MQAKLNQATLVRQWIIWLTLLSLVTVSGLVSLEPGRPALMWSGVFLLGSCLAIVAGVIFRSRHKNLSITVANGHLLMTGLVRTISVDLKDITTADVLRDADQQEIALILVSRSQKIFLDERMFYGRSEFLTILNEIVSCVPESLNSVASPKRKIPFGSLTACLLLGAAFFYLYASLGDGLEAALYEASANRDLIFSGEIYRVFTAAFLHSGIDHLVLNILSLVIVGEIMESVLKKREFLAVFLLSATLSIGLSAIAFNYDALLGSSGGVFGILGAYAYFLWRRSTEVPTIFSAPVKYLAVIGVLEIASSFYFENVATGCHVIGFMTGFLYAGRLPAAHAPGNPVGQYLPLVLVGGIGVVTVWSFSVFLANLH